MRFFSSRFKSPCSCRKKNLEFWIRELNTGAVQEPAAASGGGAGTARGDEGDGLNAWWPASRKRKGNSGEPTQDSSAAQARSSCAPPSHWVPARVLHFLFMSAVFFSVMLCMSLEVIGWWTMEETRLLGCEDVLSYGRMGEVETSCLTFI